MTDLNRNLVVIFSLFSIFERRRFFLCYHYQGPMKKQRLFLFLVFLFLVDKSSSQGVLLTQPRLVVEGNELIIFYDIIAKNVSDQFYVWVEIEKANGERILAKALSGDVGNNLKPGNNKKITWLPEQDSIYINEEIFIVVKAEKYIKSFNKGSVMLKSVVLPGWGQTKIRNGKPWWLTGVVVYGIAASGYLYNQKYHKSLDSYRAENDDPVRRAELFDQTRKELNISRTMIYSAVSAWAVNILWVAFTPNKYQPLQHYKFSLNPTPSLVSGGMLLSLKMDF